MTEIELKNRINEMLKDRCGYSDIKENYSLQNELGFDSLDKIEFIMELEEEFEIEINEDEEDKFYSDIKVFDVYEFMKNKLEKENKLTK